jgi:hypothetical protein
VGPDQGRRPNATKVEDRVEVLYQAPDVRVKRFGGEGTGGQCLWKLKWEAGQTNRFLVSAQIEGGKTAYTAWFGTAGGVWKKLACFRTRTSGKGLSGYYSFIEDFRRDGVSASQVRRARFGYGWVRTATGVWVPLAKARFTASNSEWEAKDNVDAGIQSGGFYLATGGTVRMTRDLRSQIDLPVVPSISAKLLQSLPAALVDP